MKLRSYFKFFLTILFAIFVFSSDPVRLVSSGPTRLDRTLRCYGANLSRFDPLNDPVDTNGRALASKYLKDQYHIT